MNNSIGISIDDSVDDYLRNPAFNNDLDLFDGVRKIVIEEEFDGALSFWETPQKSAILFKILWGLFFIPMFFWWDEITEMAFIILR